jgi:L-2-hydroxyglutarate oxidase LhgO
MTARARPDLDSVDALVVGAGVVGLAVGGALAAAGLETVIAERHRGIGEETSSRNSGVIHAGLYYPPDSHKARLCVRGRELLYDYCGSRGVAHQRCGKLVVAAEARLEALRALLGKSFANGVGDLRWLDGAEARELEPELRCAAALYSPSSGILDVHELMTALLGDFEAAGGMLAAGSEVTRMREAAGGLEVAIASEGETSVLLARRVVNAAGLGAVELARRIEGYPAQRIPRLHLAKGSYFSCPGRPFRRLVYPLPDHASLGIHAGLDLAGNVRFGPDVEWVEAIDYAVDPGRAAHFGAAVRAFWPALDEARLQPDFAGVRPKLVGPGEPPADFLIDGPNEHGIPGLVSLLGIESPGLTAALALGEHVCETLGLSRGS